LLSTLKIRHTTTYRFNERVSLLPHRLMLRPRESREVNLISSQITVMPDAILTWANDVFGNAVATATFQMTTTNLVIASVVELQHDAVAWPVFNIAFSAISYPFRYSNDDWTDLGALGGVDI
jgi:transglutaminase-like putative cysteine protease